MTTQTFQLDYLQTIGIVNNGFNGRGFANPYDVSIGRDGRIFVLNRCDSARRTAIRVGICNLDEDYLGEFGNGYGSGEGQLIWPVAMAMDSQDRMYITDEQNHRVVVFDSSGVFQSQWGDHGTGDGQMVGTSGIAIDSQDNVYVGDQGNNRIHKFTTDGRHLLQWGGPGDGPGQFNLPWGVGVDSSGNVYVADWRNDRIQKFTPDGDFLASYGESGDGNGQFSRPSGVAVDHDGYIYVADWGNERVQVLKPDGGFQEMLRGQATLSKWAEEFFAANPDEMRERERSNLTPELPPHLNTPYHVSSQSEPYFWGPVSVRFDAGGRLYVVESSRHRMQIYQRV